MVDIGLQRSDGNAVVHEKSVECRYEQNLSLCIGQNRAHLLTYNLFVAGQGSVVHAVENAYTSVDGSDKHSSLNQCGGGNLVFVRDGDGFLAVVAEDAEVALKPDIFFCLMNVPYFRKVAVFCRKRVHKAEIFHSACFLFVGKISEFFRASGIDTLCLAVVQQ